jgi:hypothetical protein
MPFTTNKLLNADADVKIFFSGLLVLEPTENGACQIYVNSSAPRHYLTVEVRRKRKDRPNDPMTLPIDIPDELMMRHIGPLAFLDDNAIHGMLIRKRIPHGVDGEKGVTAFKPDVQPRDGAPDRFDLAIDMQSQLLHQANPELDDPGAAENEPVKHLLDVDPLGGRPSILLEDGVLYTAAKVRDDFQVMLKKPNGDEEPMPRFASLIGAAITLETGESEVTIRWRQQGKEETLHLTKAENTTYEVYIVNDPLFESDAVEILKNPEHDEFAEYYKILHRVPTDKQFRLRVKPVEGVIPERGSTRTPCMPVVNGGG